EGLHSAIVFANDSANNINDTINISFTVDLTAPSVTFIAPVNGASVSGTQIIQARVIDNITAVNSVIFQFTNGTNPFNRTASNTSGTWNLSIDTTLLPEGAQTITAYADDFAGNVNDTESLGITINNVVVTVPGGGGAPPGGGGGAPPKEVPPAKPVCGNGVLENGEQCDSGEGCAGNCRCDAGYQTIRSVDCEQLPHCGDGMAGENEACDGADLKEQSCAKLGHAKGDLSCTPDCNFDIEGCVTYEELYRAADAEIEKTIKELKGIIPLKTKEKIDLAKNLALQNRYEDAQNLLTEIQSELLKLKLKQVVQTGKGILLDLGGVLKDYSTYWLLSGMVILTVLAGYYVRDLPIKEYLYKLKPIPQVKVEPSAVTMPSGSIVQKPLDAWGRKSYLDLQEQLRRLDQMIQEVPIAEPKAKALKLTSLRDDFLLKKKTAVVQIKDLAELELWAGQMIVLRTPEHRIKEIIRKTTNFTDAQITAVVEKIKAAELLRKKYGTDHKIVSRLKEFIHLESENGASPQQIISDLIREGWDEKTIKPFVLAHYA
ncbi:MAG: Ig-like domain-containing protein, partial [Nanoarchaeota archaeon]